MLKSYSNPYGYKKLLAYQKAKELQVECRALTAKFPRTKTLLDLADQMDRSARSTKQNIVEGWKRNSTKEYNDFLGFSVGAVAELEEDCNDIWGEVYPELLNKREVMGEKGIKGSEMGGMGNERGVRGARGFKGDIEKLRFYPLDKSLPPIVQLKLRCKELNYLITKIQTKLERKMSKEGGISNKDKIKIMTKRRNKEDRAYEDFLKENGFIRLENGRVIKK
jgi:hypothetical protein